MADGGQDGTLMVDGRSVGFRGIGRGAPLLLVNGYAATGADWDPTMIDGLAGSFRLVSPDNRGMGTFDPGDLSTLSVDGMAHDMLALLDHLGIDRGFVLGWSMGGFVAQRVA